MTPYFRSNPKILKNTLYFFLLFVIIAACNAASNKENSKDDSLQYYPPTPKEMSKDEFRSYYRVVSNFFDSGLLRSGFNGGILIAKNGNIIYEKYQGKADLRDDDSITKETPFHIASTSKTFTATAILRLYQEHKLSLDDSLTKYFPGFPYEGITLKLLLSHRSGLPNYLYFMSNSDWDKSVYVTNQDVLNFMIREKPQRYYAPNQRFDYCNTNYLLLALIIEKVTGMSYPAYMQQKFFGPLHMEHSFVFTPNDSARATPSFTARNTYWNNDFLDHTYGDKNIYATPEDLLKWDQSFYTNQVLDTQLMKAAFTPYSFEKPSIHNYGYGWRLLLLPNGKKVIYHFGKWHGFNSAFARLTDEKATIIILGNKFNRNIYRAAHTCYDIFGAYLQTTPGDEDDANESEAPATKHTPEAAKTKKK